MQCLGFQKNNILGFQKSQRKKKRGGGEQKGGKVRKDLKRVPPVDRPPKTVFAGCVHSENRPKTRTRWLKKLPTPPSLARSFRSSPLPVLSPRTKTTRVFVVAFHVSRCLRAVPDNTAREANAVVRRRRKRREEEEEEERKRESAARFAR